MALGVRGRRCERVGAEFPDRSWKSSSAGRDAHVDRRAGVAASAAPDGGGASRGREDCGEKGWPAPSYWVVRRIIAGLDRGLVSLARHGAKGYGNEFELVLRRESAHPNDLWQADHTELDVMVLDENDRPARPWLTVILDDHSRAVAGYTVFLDDPSAMQTALALRQAVWRKADPGWAVCGWPSALYSDNGADFTSDHIAQVCAGAKVQLIHSTPGKPRGRGKSERFFGTITTELLPT